MTFDLNAYQRNRRRMIAYGRWEPAALVKPDAARAHIQNLRNFGLSVRTIGAMLGRDSSILAPLVFEGHQDYAKSITAKRESQILALRFDLDALRPEAQVPNYGTVRRIEALAYMGWSAADLGERLGLSPQAIKSYRQTCPSSARTRVQVSSARAIRDLYDELSMTKGPSPRASSWAKSRGWHGPLAWDDDTIDDPDATPDLGAETPRPQGGAGRPFADVVEDIEDILSWEPYATATELAHRLGYRDSSGIQIALRRGERSDLLARLARNAETAA